MIFLFSYGFEVLELVRQKGDAELEIEYQRVTPFQAYEGGKHTRTGLHTPSEVLAM